MVQRLVIVGVVATLTASVTAGPSFVNWETPHVSPLALTPDGSRLLAVNTADNRLEVFDVNSGEPTALGAIPVGLDPVSVRARTNNEVWVVNHISDSISVVDLTTMNVVKTLSTADEPTDVVFAGTPQRAFVSCSQANTVLVFDPANLDTAPTIIAIDGEDPRAMAVSGDGSKVYVAVFESGNKTTIIGAAGGVDGTSNPLNHNNGPYGGQNPPPNDGVDFKPPMNPALPQAPTVNLIVRQNAQGQWMDDNNTDWSSYINGGLPSVRRPAGWDMLDNDVAVIDANSLQVSYLTGMMHLCMGIAVHPTSGLVTVVGIEAINEIRFEPNLTGRFVRVHIALGDEASPDQPAVLDLNPHLDYSDAQIAQQSNTATASQALRDLSIGDPRSIVWMGTGSGYIAGMGSNNVVRVDATGARIGDPIEVGEGPTGLALNEAANRLFVLNKFDGSITVIDTTTNLASAAAPFFDPTPTVIKMGRRQLYDTHTTSGLGQLACASCHVDARIDRLAWDLGNPAGEMSPMDQNCNASVDPINCPDFHPMKGPMTTQTFQDIIGNEPFHWRGDKNGLEEFNGAFTGLQGDDVMLTAQEMQEYEDFLATIFYPPNPFRNLDNSLPSDLPLPGHYASGEFESVGGLAQGAPLPNGDAVLGLDGYINRAAHSSSGLSNRSCVSCHTLPTGLGTDHVFVGDSELFPNAGAGEYVPVELGLDGENFTSITHLGLDKEQRRVSVKIVQLRNMYDKVGFNRDVLLSRSGFGFFNAGSESLEGFMYEFKKFPDSDQEVADVVALLLAFTGSDMPAPNPNNLREPPGPSSQDSHAAVGAQFTVDETNNADAGTIDWLNQVAGFADAGKVGLIAKGRQNDETRGYAYIGSGSFQSDRVSEIISLDDLRLAGAAGSEITFTVVPEGGQTRIGIDRDEDSFPDRDELDAGTDPTDANSFPDVTAVGCSDIRSLRARCQGGLFKVVIRLFDNSHDGQDVTIDVNGTEFVLPINGTKARMQLAGQAGSMTVTLVSPSGCSLSRTVDCN